MRALSWTLGVVFLLTAVTVSIGAPLAALPMLVAAGLVLPPVRAWFATRTNLRLGRRARGLAVLLCGIAFLWLGARRGGELQAETDRRARQEWQQKKPDVLAAVQNAAAAGRHEEALAAAAPYRGLGDAELEAAVAAATRAVEIPKLLRRAEATEDLAERRRILLQMTQLDPANKEWRARLANLDQGLALQAARDRRREQLSPIFSGWDGSVRALVEAVKASMNDPKTFEHVKTTYVDAGDHLEVTMTFRGTNAFGGVVTNRVVADVDLAGRVLRIKSRG